MDKRTVLDKSAFLNGINSVSTEMQTDAKNYLKALVIGEVVSDTDSASQDLVKEFKKNVKVTALDGNNSFNFPDEVYDFPDEVYATVMNRVIAVEPDKFSTMNKNDLTGGSLVIKNITSYVQNLLDSNTETISINNTDYTFSNIFGQALGLVSVTVNGKSYAFSWSNEDSLQKTVDSFENMINNLGKEKVNVWLVLIGLYEDFSPLIRSEGFKELGKDFASNTPNAFKKKIADIFARISPKVPENSPTGVLADFTLESSKKSSESIFSFIKEVLTYKSEINKALDEMTKLEQTPSFGVPSNALTGADIFRSLDENSASFFTKSLNVKFAKTIDATTTIKNIASAFVKYISDQIFSAEGNKLAKSVTDKYQNFEKRVEELKAEFDDSGKEISSDSKSYKNFISAGKELAESMDIDFGISIDDYYLTEFSDVKNDIINESRALINGTNDDNTIMSAGSLVTINGNDGNDKIVADGSGIANGGNGNDTIIVTEKGSFYHISGNEGDELIDVWGKYVTVDGGTGNDTINVNSSNVTVDGGTGADMIVISDSIKGTDIRNFDDSDVLNISMYKANEISAESDGSTYTRLYLRNNMPKSYEETILTLSGVTGSQSNNIICRDENGDTVAVSLDWIIENTPPIKNPYDRDSDSNNNGDSVKPDSDSGNSTQDGGKDTQPSIIVDENWNITGTDGDDSILNINVGDVITTIDSGNGQDTIVNYGDTAIVNCGKGSDSIKNYGEKSSIYGGENDDTIQNANSYVYISGDQGDDLIINEAYKLNKILGTSKNDTLFAQKNSFIYPSEGSDIVVVDGAMNATIDCSLGNNTIYFPWDSKYLSTSPSSITLVNFNSKKDNLSFPSWAFTSRTYYFRAQVKNGDLILRDGLGFYTMTFKGITSTDDIKDTYVDAWGYGQRLGSILYNRVTDEFNENNNTSLKFKDLTTGSSDIVDNVTISGGAGNDKISLASSDSFNVIKYENGDGNDIVYGFGANSMLNIADAKYTSVRSNNDIIITVGDGKITLVGTASLSNLNIEGTFDDSDEKDSIDAITTLPTPVPTDDTPIIPSTPYEPIEKNNNDTYEYTGGNKTITNYSAEEKLQMPSSITSVYVSENNLALKSGEGELTVTDARDNLIDITNAEGNTTAQVYMSKDGGEVAANALGNSPEIFKVLVGSPENKNHLIAGDGGASLVGGDTDDILEGGIGHTAFSYHSGNDTIKSYKSSDEIIFDGTYIDFAVSDNDLVLNAAEGSLRIQDAKNKWIDITDSNGDVLANFYLSSEGGILDGRLQGGKTVLIGADNVDNQIFAGEGDSTLWGGNGGINVLVGGNGEDIFMFGSNDELTLIQNASSEDTINLYDLSIDDIKNLSATTSGRKMLLRFGNDAEMIVQTSGSASPTFQDSAGINWRYN